MFCCLTSNEERVKVKLFRKCIKLKYVAQLWFVRFKKGEGAGASLKSAKTLGGENQTHTDAAYLFFNDKN